LIRYLMGANAVIELLMIPGARSLAAHGRKLPSRSDCR
jgi:hypothetical protein